MSKTVVFIKDSLHIDILLAIQDNFTFSEVHKWLNDNMCGEWHLSRHRRKSAILFYNESDAMAFKLTWNEFCDD